MQSQEKPTLLGEAITGSADSPSALIAPSLLDASDVATIAADLVEFGKGLLAEEDRIDRERAAEFHEKVIRNEVARHQGEILYRSMGLITQMLPEDALAEVRKLVYNALSDYKQRL